MAGLPQLLQTTGAWGILAPHRLQNCASSSDTTVPHPGQTGNAGFFSSGTAAPHRLQNCAWSSSAAWPHLPQVFVMYFTKDKTGRSINTVMLFFLHLYKPALFRVLSKQETSFGY
jgi:hypothetical protein